MNASSNLNPLDEVQQRTQNNAVDFKQNDDYVNSLPEPPRTRILPSSSDLRQTLLDAAESTGLAFLSCLNWHPFHSEDLVVDWEYNDRRKPHVVLPFLSVGPASVVREEGVLTGEQVTMILSLRNTLGMPSARIPASLQQAQSRGIEVHIVNVKQANTMVRTFSDCTRLINAHLKERKTSISKYNNRYGAAGMVLLTCESGNHTSAATAVAYLMEMFSLDLITAGTYVSARRYSVMLDDDLMQSLEVYEELLLARRVVENSSHSMKSLAAGHRHVMTATPLLSAKRARDDSENDIAGAASTVPNNQPSADTRLFIPFRDLPG